MKKLITSLKIVPRWIILFIDFFILLISFSITYLLIFDFNMSKIETPNFGIEIMVYSICHLVAILATRSYSGIIRHTSLQDGIRIAYTLVIGVGLILAVNAVYLFFYQSTFIPLRILLASILNAIVFLFAYRLIVKFIFAHFLRRINYQKSNVLIFGAGQLGLITKQIIEHDTLSNLKVVGFIDDDVRKTGKKINGIKIYDASNKIDTICQNLEVDEVIIAIQQVSSERKNELVDTCLRNNIKVKSTPPAHKWVNGEFKINEIENINIEDLLDRASIKLNNIQVRRELKDKCVLITGAAGSIGKEIAQQVISYNPESVILLDQSETGLYELDQELAHVKAFCNIKIVLADITNFDRVEQIFNSYKPEVVFHAAAYKHVPMMESNPSEAILGNVMGTKNLADISVKYYVKKFVMISTDKAVNPTNVMGASKRIAEKYVQSFNDYLKTEQRTVTSFVTVRFGNVLGSNGSVIPLFKKQIAKGGPLTITHPEVTRYFMTIPEACQLVLEAGAMGKGGEIFIFDMGQPVKIANLARKMIRLAGLRPDEDIEIIFTGLRDGEKLYEELLNNKENSMPTYHPKIMIAKVLEEPYFEVKESIERLVDEAYSGNEFAIVDIMKYIVPEYVSNNSRFVALDTKRLQA